MSLPVCIVLIDTAHPGNIGAVARAMKNMDVHDLALVRPKVFPSEEATARASGADDVLAKARVVGTLEEALADCGQVAGTTSRDRMHYFNVFDVRTAALRILGDAGTGASGSGGSGGSSGGSDGGAEEANTTTNMRRPAAIVFGSERFGLTNEELTRCNWLIRVPTSAEYASLNLAMAVQIVCYELFMARGAEVPKPERETPLANAADVERLYAHWDQVLKEIDFVDRTQSGSHLMNRFRRLFGRAELDQNEVNILRGFLTAVQKRRRRAGTQ